MTAAPGPGSTGRPGFLLKRAQSVLHAAMAAALHEHDATVGQYALLTALDEEPGLSNADLARRAFVTPQTMNQLLRELENKRWVTRRPHPVHGRILQADLTQQGHAALRSCHQAVDAIEEQMLAGLSPAHRQQLTAALRACIEALSPSRQRAPSAQAGARTVGLGLYPALVEPAFLDDGHQLVRMLRHGDVASGSPSTTSRSAARPRWFTQRGWC